MDKPTVSVDVDEERAIVSHAGGVRDGDLSAGDSIFSKVQRYVGSIGVEKRGIERVPDTVEERTDTSMSKVGTVWLSSNLALACFGIGAIAPSVFGLGFVDSMLAILFFNVLGVLPTSFFSTFGPVFGLRQLVLSRFYFGWYGVKLYAFFNVLTCLGWSTLQIVTGAQLFHAINPNMPGWAGILVIAFLTLLVGGFGYKAVHRYQRWSWIPMFIIYMILLGEFAASGRFNSLLPLESGPVEAGRILSFGSTVFGAATGLCVYAADYTVYQPGSSPRTTVFLWSFAGLLLPLIFVEALGCAVATATVDVDSFAQAWEEGGVGGLIGIVLIPPLGDFGRFCLVLLALGVIANNCPNVYSVSFGMQVLSRQSARVPRIIWTVLGVFAAVGIGIPAYDNFAPWLETFLLTTAYWLAIYEGIALTEHFVFRRGIKGYRPEDYDTPKMLPVGRAALVSFGFGVAGCVLGMTQEWWTGPIGALCGGDLGFELAFGLSAVSYTVLRFFERNKFKR
ncbi:purine-cytosine permease [Rhypophila sp. PSN 637]